MLLRTRHLLSRHSLSPATSRTDCEQPHWVDQLPAMPLDVGTGSPHHEDEHDHQHGPDDYHATPTLRNVPVDDDLWSHALTMAAARGENLFALINRMLASYVEYPHGVLPSTALGQRSDRQTAP